MNTPKQKTIKNTNVWSTRQLVSMALFCALAVILSFIELPLFPAAPFLKYDASFMPSLVAGFAFGPAAGIAVGVVAAVIHGLFMSNWVGALMNAIVVVCYIVPAALIYKKHPTLKFMILGFIISIICATLAAITANLTIGVICWYGTIDAVLPLVFPVLLPFNLLKHTLNSLLTLLVFKSIKNLLISKTQ